MADNFFGLTDTGRLRENNEDTFILQQSADGRYILAAAIDGVGGYSGGEIAASLAKESIINYFNKSGDDIASMMFESILDANLRIHRKKAEVPEYDSMACVLTFAVVDITNNEFHYIHIGDTRLYLFRDGSLVKLSKDHSFVGFLEDTGRLTEQAAMNHPKRNEINKALGFDIASQSETGYFETGLSPFLPGDIILLCSDGLTDMLPSQMITEILSQNISLEEMCTVLVQEANSRGGRDNITAVLVKNDKPVSDHSFPRPYRDTMKKTTPPEPSSTGIVAESVLPPEEVKLGENKSSARVSILIVLCVVLLITTVYLGLPRFWKTLLSGKETEIVDTLRSPFEMQLSQAISNLKTDTLILNDSVYTGPIRISRPIEIFRDTLYIISRGKIILKPDSAYIGPAMKISRKAKNITLNGVIFEGFNTAIESQTNNVTMEGVRFMNCGVSVQYQFNATKDSVLNGTLRDLFLSSDSIARGVQDDYVKK